MKQSLRLGTFSGIAVGVNWSVFVIAALFAVELAEYVLPARSGHADAADWIAGVIGAVVLMASVLAHEVSHAVVARHNDVRVRSITLFIFGGVAQLEGEAHTPGADFRIAAVGPATSVALAAVFGVADVVLVAGGGHGLPVTTLAWLCEINLLLAVFNLIPAAPLDGGRILRAGLWHRWNDRLRASAAAARAGKGFAVGLIALGLVGALYVGFTGLWAAFIGLFLYSAARAEEQFVQLQGALASIPVSQVMTSNPPAVPGRTTVTDLLARYISHYRGDAVAVTGEGGWLAGVVTARAVRAVPPDRRDVTTVAEIALPLDAVVVARPEEPMGAVLERMMSRGGNPVLVLDADNRLAGIVTLSDIERAASFGVGRWPENVGQR
jgi:Zn-dependent protease/CBS domain-containing protein